ncbi:unnamed protein product, partial [Ectocarpus fasciculatus]
GPGPERRGHSHQPWQCAQTGRGIGRGDSGVRGSYASRQQQPDGGLQPGRNLAGQLRGREGDRVLQPHHPDRPGLCGRSLQPGNMPGDSGPFR